MWHVPNKKTCTRNIYVLILGLLVINPSATYQFYPCKPFSLQTYAFRAVGIVATTIGLYHVWKLGKSTFFNRPVHKLPSPTDSHKTVQSIDPTSLIVRPFDINNDLIKIEKLDYSPKTELEAQKLIAQGGCFVLETNNNIIGYVAWDYPHLKKKNYPTVFYDNIEYDPDVARITGLAIDSKHERNGYGTFLLDYALIHIKKICYAKVSVTAANDRLDGFYKRKIGFRDVTGNDKGVDPTTWFVIDLTTYQGRPDNILLK